MINTNQKFLPLISESIRQNWDRPALSDHEGATLHYKDFGREIKKLHLLFEVLGIEKGDKIALCGRNSANWAVTFFASLSYGAVVTTILHDFIGESIEAIVNHSESKVLFIEEFALSKINPESIPNANTIFLINDFSIIKTASEDLPKARENWDNLFVTKYPNGFSADDLNFHDESAEEMAVLNYTSGTTSAPKGVMLPYRSLWSNTDFAIEKIPFVSTGDGIVCMLPMAHMYGLAFEILLGIAKGCHINFLTRVPSPQIIMGAFAKIKPTLVLAVPLIIEKIIQGRVFPELKKQPTKTLLQIPGLRNIVYKKVHAKLIETFGGQVKEVVIGGAALNKEVGDFLTTIRFPYTVGYGMTECGPLIAYEYWEDYAKESCGKAVSRMEVKIESNDPENVPGEILTKGSNVMLGYFKNEEATKATFNDEGWLKTGDLGIIDKKGNIFIKGRSKTMILGPSGQNIYPEEIEGMINNLNYVSESLVIEDKGKLIALIFPDLEKMQKEGISQDQITAIFEEELKPMNKRLPNYSKIAQIRVRDTEFEKTPKRSIKRFLYQP